MIPLLFLVADSDQGRILVRKFVAVVLCMFLAVPAFTQAQNSGVRSALKNSFPEVSSHLDPGGNLYLYLSTEEWVRGLSGQVSQLGDIVNAVSGGSPNDKQNIARLIDV